MIFVNSFCYLYLVPEFADSSGTGIVTKYMVKLQIVFTTYMFDEFDFLNGPIVSISTISKGFSGVSVIFIGSFILRSFFELLARMTIFDKILNIFSDISPMEVGLYFCMHFLLSTMCAVNRIIMIFI